MQMQNLPSIVFRTFEGLGAVADVTSRALNGSVATQPLSASETTLQMHTELAAGLMHPFVMIIRVLT